jgi:hypothetical protein
LLLSSQFARIATWCVEARDCTLDASLSLGTREDKASLLLSSQMFLL